MSALATAMPEAGSTLDSEQIVAMVTVATATEKLGITLIPALVLVPVGAAVEHEQCCSPYALPNPAVFIWT